MVWRIPIASFVVILGPGHILHANKFFSDDTWTCNSYYFFRFFFCLYSWFRVWCINIDMMYGFFRSRAHILMNVVLPIRYPSILPRSLPLFSMVFADGCWAHLRWIAGYQDVAPSFIPNKIEVFSLVGQGSSLDYNHYNYLQVLKKYLLCNYKKDDQTELRV